MTIRIEGMAELQRTIRQLGRLPQKCVTKAARQGALLALRAARRMAPRKTGALRRGLKLQGERRTVYGKKVYQVVMNATMNNIFVKMTVGGRRYYYPASQEYGFITASGQKTAGKHFLRDSLEENKSQIEQKMVGVLAREIDRLR